MMNVRGRLAVAALLLMAALGLAPQPLRAQESTSELLARIQGADPGLQSYTAAVEFNVGLLSFPYLKKTLHGDAFFKRPGRMEVVFNDLPSYARGFRNVYVGLGTPNDWDRKYVLGTAETTVDGKPVTYLVMTPRKADRRLKGIDVFLDERTALPTRIVWRYADGRIEMTQQIVDVDGHALVGGQDADIRLPGVHAFVRSRVSRYALNVPVDDAVFTKKKTQDDR